MHSTQVIFGWNAMWFASGIFALVYAVIISEKLNRAILALLGACCMIAGGLVSQDAAIDGVDFNTIGLLLGMMLIVGITARSGVFQFVAVWSAKRVNAQPIGVLFMLALVTAALSAVLDNVTTVLLIVPVTLLITEELGVKAYPYLITEVLFSNIGGTATLIGDPPNIMIGSSVGLTFNQFLLNLGPAIILVMGATAAPLYFVWRRELVAPPEARARVMAYKERDAIRDPRLLRQSLAVIALVIGGFALAHALHIPPATVAMSGAAVLLFLDNYRRGAEQQSHAVQKAFADVEWVTLMFFVGLFVLVKGLNESGVIRLLAEKLLEATGGDRFLAAIVILWGSAILSAFIDNIPFVATMIPLIKNMSPTFGGDEALLPLWWALSLGACLGGNGTLIGASANLIVAGLAERSGHRISFVSYFQSCFLLMILSIIVSHLYLVWRYF